MLVAYQTDFLFNPNPTEAKYVLKVVFNHKKCGHVVTLTDDFVFKMRCPICNRIIKPQITFKVRPIEDETHFYDCQLIQFYPHTEILENFPNCTFEMCNLTNVEHPNYDSAIDCLRIQKEFCSHNNPHLIDMGMRPCRMNCSHLREYHRTLNRNGIDEDDVLICEDVLIEQSPNHDANGTLDGQRVRRNRRTSRNRRFIPVSVPENRRAAVRAKYRRTLRSEL